MSAETKQVLEMLTEGKITAEEAEKLIDKLSGTGTSRSGAPADPGASAEGTGASSTANGARKQRFLRIQVERPGRDHVNLRVPIALATAGGLLAMVSPRVTERLAEQGVDLTGLSGLKGADLEEALRSINIDVEKGDGKRVRIFCE